MSPLLPTHRSPLLGTPSVKGGISYRWWICTFESLKLDFHIWFHVQWSRGWLMKMDKCIVICSPCQTKLISPLSFSLYVYLSLSLSHTHIHYTQTSKLLYNHYAVIFILPIVCHFWNILWLESFNMVLPQLGFFYLQFVFIVPLCLFMAHFFLSSEQ